MHSRPIRLVSSVIDTFIYNDRHIVKRRVTRIELNNRIAPVTAHSIATINQMAPGRVILGIGTGFTGRNMMGLPPVPLASLREHVNMCRALLNGEEVLYREGKRERWIRLMNPAGGYINIKDPIPIIIAAQGPKALELAGEVGDGWVALSSDLPSFQQNLATVRGSAQRAHKPVDNLSATMFCAACVLRPGEPLTSPRVLQWVGPIAAMALHRLWESSALASQLPPTLAPLAERYRTEYVDKLDLPADRRYMKVHGGHLMYVNPGEEPFLTADFVEKNCPAICRFETPQTSLRRTGETAFLVAEEFRSNERWRDRRAVHCDKRSISAL
jgi:5,10-methylenetetrahydromethanopterin reductase